jgi:hypothetical protein
MIHSAFPRCILQPPVQSGASETKETLHTYFTLGRTNKLRHILSPDENSVERRLQGVLANMYSQPFPSLEVAKKSFYTQLKNIYPIIPNSFEERIEEAETVESISVPKGFINENSFPVKSIRDVAMDIFRSKTRDAKNWTTAIRNDLNSPVRSKDGTKSSEKQIPINKLGIRMMWRKMSVSDLPFEELKDLLRTQIKNFTLPEAVQTLYNEFENTTDLESLKSFIDDRLRMLDTDTASNSVSTTTVKSSIEKSLRIIWDSILTMNFPDKDSVLDFIHRKLEENEIPPGIIDLYMKDLVLASGVQSVKNRAKRYLQDLITIHSPINLNPTSSGDEGHPMIIDLQASERVSGFMKFLGKPEEIDHNRLYSWILDVSNLPLKAPEGAAINHSSHPAFTKPNGKLKELTADEALYIKELSTFIATANAPRNRVRTIDEEVEFQRNIQIQTVGLFEKVIGENLENFALTSYSNLATDEKASFFVRLGMTCFLDLVLGNQDRLALFNMDTPLIDEDPLAANLGNIMIPPDRSFMYLIDNGVNNGKLSSDISLEKMSQNYLQFLKSLFLNEDGKKEFGITVLKSLLSGLEGLDEQGEQAFQIDIENALSVSKKGLYEKIKKANNHIARLQEQQNHTKKASAGRAKRCSLKEQESNYRLSVLSELEKEKAKLLPISALIKGMKIMEATLVKKVIPLWNSPESKRFKETFSPQFVDIITNRLDTLAESVYTPHNFKSTIGA